MLGNTTPPKAATPSADLKLWLVLAKAYDAVRAHAFADIERHGLTPGEFGVLDSLYHKGPMLLGELQHRVLVTSGGISYLTDRLERRGLVERRDYAADRRTKEVALTPEGEALMRRVFPEHTAAIERALAGVDPAVKEAAASLLRTVGRAAAAVPISQ
ncbi:MAG TPA: MarR family transcriptional regulator [Gemmatimonadaceae bacterium]|nr:MarR family transcriptional regulator [Gemmatimonadaceae bacterium]